MKTILILLILAAFLAISAPAKTQTVPDAQRHFEKANDLLKRMDYDGAIAEYTKVMTLSSDSKIAQDARYWIGQSQFRAGRFDAAQATFAKLIEQYPTSAIVPATKLMVERVEEAKKTEAIRRAMSDTADQGYIIDPTTGVKYTKIAAFTGKHDVIEYSAGVNLSPNGKFLLYMGTVVPLDGSEPFDLVDTTALRGVWSPDGGKVAYYSGDGICIVPVSPQTGRPTGPVRKLHEGRYMFGHSACWSPDAQKLAFMKDWDIWTLSVTDGSLTRIPVTNGFGRPTWSPDGTTILYGLMEGGGAHYSLCTVSADGQALNKVVAPLGSSTLRTAVRDWYWSPDGKWILYKRFGGRMYLLNLNQDQELETKPPSEVGDFFSWSPDGTKMLFYRESYDLRYEIRVVSASGGPPIALKGPTKSWPQHGWSPDSKAVLVAGYKDGRHGLWISPLAGGDPVLLEVDVSVAGKPLFFEVSPTGQMLAFVVDREKGARDLYVVPVSLKDARATGPAVKVFEGWQPRYASDRIYMEASWSPDGTKLAVVHGKDIWIAFSNGDKPVQLIQGIGGFYPDWSPDGKMVYYMAWTKEGLEGGLYVISSRGGSPARVMSSKRTSSGWSPDSKKLTLVSEDSISTVTVADGQAREVAKLKDLGLGWVSYLSWSPDGKYIACDGREKDKPSPSPIILIPVVGGKPTMLADDDTWKTDLHWSPDGKWISYRSSGPVKVRPEGILWEADFQEIVRSASR